MNLIADVFTDACNYEGVNTGCTAVTGKKLPLTFVAEYFPQAAGSTDAEILSAIAGMARVPTHRTIRLFTDMDVLIDHYYHRGLKKCKRAGPLLDLFFAEIENHEDVQVFRVKRSHGYYRQCHRKARDLAHGIFKLSSYDPTLDRRVIADQIRWKMVSEKALLSNGRKPIVEAPEPQRDLLIRMAEFPGFPGDRLDAK